ncbi:MAG: D-alanyl-D-alanine carboxypeptidase [Holosporales bacterium]|jgi:D-alanyl-D-alanine carboxypeptidase (penicillin-binding protein 5/6)|nr:D-alanyl-D-alanine carboxypeptidase [Holosporales bacterium]
MISRLLFIAIQFIGCSASFVLSGESTKQVSQKSKEGSTSQSREKRNSSSPKKKVPSNVQVDEIVEDQSDSQNVASQYNITNLPVTTSKQAYLIDFASGAVLFEKNANDLMSPSSMTKIATACCIAERIKSNETSLDSKCSVPRSAYRKEGSTMFLNIGQSVSIEDLLNGLIIVSANDAAVALGDAVCGSEIALAVAMTSLAKSWGCARTTFKNGSGLPDAEHKTTAHDLAIIASHAISDYPEFLHLYSQKEFSFNGVTQQNKNILLSRNIGCDGLKTGHTNDGGYGIVVTCVQDGRRLILVVNGYKGEQERASDASALIAWGAKTFVNHSLFKANAIIGKIPVWYGDESELPIAVENDVVVTVPSASKHDVKIMIQYETPVSAPIQKGSTVGEIRITSNTFKFPVVIPLVAAISVKEGGFCTKVKDSFRYLVWGARSPKMVDVGASKG